MLVALTAVVAAGFYAANVPVKLAFCARAGGVTGASLGLSVFEGRFALSAAQRKIGRQERPSKRKKRKMPPLGALASAARRLLAHAKLEYLQVTLDLGLSDAAGTALAVGCVNALVASARAATGARVDARVRPDFRGARIEGEVSGIVSLAAGHIMVAALLGAIEMSGRNLHGQAPD